MLLFNFLTPFSLVLWDEEYTDLCVAEAQSKSKRHIKSYGNYDDYTNSRGTYTSYRNYKGGVAAKVGEGE